MLDLRQLHSDVRALTSGDGPTWREAVRSLKQHPGSAWVGAPPESVAPVISALCRHLPGGSAGAAKGATPCRLEAVTLLASIGPPAAAAVPQLTELLHDGVAPALREAAVTALGNIGSAAADATAALVAMLTPGCRVSLASRVARALGDIGRADKRVRTALASLFQGTMPCPNGRAQVALALSKLHTDAPGLREYLAALLVSNPGAPLRRVAAESLAWHRKDEPGIVPALIAALGDADEEVRRIAQTGLERLKLSQEKALKLCGKQLADSPHAEIALRRAGPPAVPALIDALRSDDAVVRAKAARVLGSIGEGAAAAVTALTEVLKDDCPEARLAAAKARWCVTHEPGPSVRVLTGLLSRRWPAGPTVAEQRRQFLQTVMEALHRIGPAAAAAAPALQRQARDENRLIRECAQRALREICPPEPAQVATG